MEWFQYYFSGLRSPQPVERSKHKANDLFLFMATKCLRFLQEINQQWKPAIAVLIMVLVNIACARIVEAGARIVEDGAVKTRTFVSGLMKKKILVKRNACGNVRVLNTDVKVTRSGTVYGSRPYEDI
ncbi:uncharacterized protein LOC121373782 isoform X2 [Gigantopelta aegis]|uniref:uncharacterized protein LOC121373782 isoform X2 n=1 Tax=Gigantopelta aegis TaxID=1735272 RepID=UPI001B889BF3|nr:uncharacterized protein LOC121373782 isoform X2 [Gigantopelta aegis]